MAPITETIMEMIMEEVVTEMITMEMTVTETTMTLTAAATILTMTGNGVMRARLDLMDQSRTTATASPSLFRGRRSTSCTRSCQPGASTGPLLSGWSLKGWRPCSTFLRPQVISMKKKWMWHEYFLNFISFPPSIPVMWCDQKIEIGIYNAKTRFFFMSEGANFTKEIFSVC